MWEKGTNDKYRMAVSKMVNQAKIDRLAKCVYFVLTKIRFPFSEINWSYSKGLDNCMVVLARYKYFWYFGIG